VRPLRAVVLLLAGLGLPAPAAAQCPFPGLDEPGRIPGVPFEELVRQADEAWEQDRAADAVRFHRAGVDLNPLWHDGWWRLAQILSEAGCLEPAREALRRVVQLRPEAGPGWLLLGLAEYGLGRYEPAFLALSRGLALGSASAPEIGRKGLHTQTLLFLRRGDFTSPSKSFPILLRIEPDEPELVTACGLMALRRAQLPSEVPPADREVVAAAGRAACAAFAGRADEAREGFRELTVRFPGVRGVNFAYGLVLAREGSPDALPALRREAELFPDHGEAHLEIAFAILERGDAREAVEAARAAVRLMPDSPWSRFALGRTLLATDRVEEAVAELEQASRLGPDLRDVYVFLAQAYARAGRAADVERAREALRRLDSAQGAGR
jgi:predicted Zn-dependent protease